MSEEHPHRAPDVRPGPLTRIARAAGQGRERPLPRPRVQPLEPIHRSWLAALWRARISVRAGVTLDDYLRARLAHYLAVLPLPHAHLPLAVEIDDGQIVARPAEPPPPPPGPGVDRDCPGWLAPLVEAEGPAVRQEVAELEVRLAVVEREIEAARSRAEELSRRLAADVSTGLVAAPPSVDATAEQLGRPVVRTPAPRVLALGFAAASLAAETWQIALPLLRSAGVDPAALAAEAHRAPAEVGFGVAFALGVAAGLFALAHAAVASAAELFREGTADGRRRWLAAATLGASALAAVVALAVAALRPRGGAPGGSFVLLALAVPLSASLALRAARTDADARAAEAAAALAWDRERARALAERARRLEELSWAEDDQRSLERQRDAARRRLHELNARAVEAGRLATDASERRRAAVSKVAQTLLAALELDRYEFVRQASVRGASELLASRRRKAAAFDPASPPAPPEVEPGRLAS